MKSRATPGASVDILPSGFRLCIPDGGNRHYRLAQLDDYTHLARRRFPSHPPRNLSLRARASSDSLPGTWGFGLWNHPFGLSLGFGGNSFRLPTLPNAIWFFHASDENHLSFRDKPGNGFLAQVFRSPTLPLSYFARVGITFPFSRVKARKMLSELVEEDGTCFEVDVTQWHNYRLIWGPEQCSFWVDDGLVLETSLSPHPPLGLVIWIDNQYASWRPDGKIGFGLLENESCWLELEEIEIT